MKRIEIDKMDTEDLRELMRDIIQQEIPVILKEFITPPKKEILMTRDEVAKALRISIPTLGNYTKYGLLKSYRLGSRVLYKESEVMLFLRE